VDIDCIALHQILIKFGNIIYDRWGIDNVLKTPIPMLAIDKFLIIFLTN